MECRPEDDVTTKTAAITEAFTKAVNASSMTDLNDASDCSVAAEIIRKRKKEEKERGGENEEAINLFLGSTSKKETKQRSLTNNGLKLGNTITEKEAISQGSMMNSVEEEVEEEGETKETGEKGVNLVIE